MNCRLTTTLAILGVVVAAIPVLALGDSRRGGGRDTSVGASFGASSVRPPQITPIHGRLVRIADLRRSIERN